VRREQSSTTASDLSRSEAPIAAAPPAQPLTERHLEVRRATEALAEPLTEEDCVVQSMEDASPTKWHLAHTTWFFETFVLEPHLAGYSVYDEHYRVLFNSYYNTVGEQHPRPERGLLSRPSLSEVLAYREHVDAHLRTLLTRRSAAPRIAALVELGLNHEQQHQELILTDLKHMLSCNPLRPAYRKAALDSGAEAKSVQWYGFAEGLRWIGRGEEGFAFDNERPRHRTFVEAFEIASRPVTNGDFLAFMSDDGYERPELWLSDGWAECQREGWTAPLYWRRDGEDEAWRTMTLSGERAVSADEPVCHVSHYEADAYARWAGARLPTEAEWELAASEAPIAGNLLEAGRLHPRSAGRHCSEAWPSQLFGDVWEWTQSAYIPYPGFSAPEGAIGEYNGKFMCNQMVLRGGSCATPVSHLRRTYRNFFPSNARWQFSGLRLARDAS